MFFDRPESGELAILVHVDFPEGDNREDPREFEELVLTAGGDPVDFVTGKRVKPDTKTFVGKGKLEEIRLIKEMHGADLVIFNHAVSPRQERNLEAVLECRVLDRTGLILDIFAQRARTHEGKLQVELAQLQHQSTRLIGGWTHLERQKGGIGMRGPGETQLETDRRLLRARMKAIKSRLEKVRSQREQGRRARLRSSIQTVAIVGYTNAGKSTLFNSITNSAIYAADQLFATLDPTLRRLDVPDVGEIVLADTVGFIRHLPHKLVEAFRATLQETAEADLLLHVVDCASSERDANIVQVEHVLAEIDADSSTQLRIYNKIDLLENGEARIDRDAEGTPVAVWVSAQKNLGLELIQQALAELLANEIFSQQICLKQYGEDSKLRALLYERQAVLSENYNEQGDSELDVRLQLSDFKQLLAKADVAAERFLTVEKPDWQK